MKKLLILLLLLLPLNCFAIEYDVSNIDINVVCDASPLGGVSLRIQYDDQPLFNIAVSVPEGYDMTKEEAIALVEMIKADVIYTADMMVIYIDTLEDVSTLYE